MPLRWEVFSSFEPEPTCGGSAPSPRPFSPRLWERLLVRICLLARRTLRLCQLNTCLRWGVVFLLFLSSCGYRLGDTGLLCHYSSLSIPFICGDDRGWLSEALIVELSKRGKIRYTPCSGQLLLSGSIEDFGRENIGFQYDENKQGMRTNRIVANEGRLYMVVKVSVSNSSGCVLLGPIKFSSYVDYDFNPLSTDTELTTFSLGQFTEIDQAEEVALRPLYHDLAQKIVDYLRSYW